MLSMRCRQLPIENEVCALCPSLTATTVYLLRSRILAPASRQEMSTASSIFSSPPSLTAWEWVSRYAARSSKLMAEDYQRHRATHTEQSSRLFCRLAAMACSGLPDTSFDHLARMAGAC